ncbi:unnamed protein product [Rotaria sp. Silwood1]|nr:unnamed protein product [Rotaria sp. Silwood1]CAF4854130.1 unnamed protein product [Rotaria sp. Silwood1]
MLLNTRRSPTRVDICDFNRLYLRDHNSNTNARNYLLSKSSPPPKSYRDLRLVVTNRIPSNIVILSKTSSFSPTSINPSKLQRRKSAQKKNKKQPGFDVYRSLVRSISHCSISSERDLSNDEMNHLANSFTVDRIALSPSAGYFYSHNLPKTEKTYTYSNDKRRPLSRARTLYESYSSSRFENLDYMRSISPETFHRTTPINQYYEEDSDETLTTTTNVLPSTPTIRTRKEIHVYIPQVSC